VAAVLIEIFWKFVRKDVFDDLKMGHLGSKTRLKELKIEKAC
jgi:hypothetical protein